MFNTLFSQFNPADKTAFAPVQSGSPAEAALLSQIAEASVGDPVIGAKIGAKELTQRMLSMMKTERGVHVDSVLYALGAMAGYACQAAVRYQALAQGLPEYALLTVVETTDGKTFYFGEHLNKPLAEAQYSVWGIAAGGAQQAGCTALPDLGAIFKHVSEDVGSETFGVPRVPEQNKIADMPLDFLLGIWPALVPMFAKFCPDPGLWPVMLALSAQEVIIMGKQAIDPAVALTLFMESAVPMSKVDIQQD